MEQTLVSRYIAFADLLGFSDLVRNNDHSALMDIYRHVLHDVIDFGVGVGSDHDPNLAVLNMRLISDSVILWTESDGPADFEFMVMAVANLLAAGMHHGLPMRAAISWGHFDHIHEDYPNPRLKIETLVGLGFIKAYEAEGKQQWSGGIVLPEATDHYEMDAVASSGASGLSGLTENGWLLLYDVPTRADSIHLYAINWTRPFQTAPLGEGDVVLPFSDHNKVVTPEVERKIDNTLEFVRSLNRLA